MKNLIIVLFTMLSVNTLNASQPPLVTETWGSDGLVLYVMEDQSAVLSFDCATGQVPAGRWPMNQSRISAKGTYTQRTGFRPPSGRNPQPVEAGYTANINQLKGLMTLTMKISKTPARTFKLIKGNEGGLKRCM